MIFHDCDGNEVAYDNSPLSWRVSVYAVILQGDQVLLIKNKEEKLYDIPGGGIEMEESIEDALKRESMEEAGIQIKIGKLIHLAQDYFYHKEQEKFYKTIQLFYLGALEGGLGKPTDKRTEFVGFVSRGKLGNFPLPQAVQDAIAML